MDLDAAIEAEAEAQAICMQTNDFHRAYEAFVAKQPPRSKATETRSRPAMNRDHLDWPFFDAAHRALAADVERWAPMPALRSRARRSSMPPAAISCARSGEAGWLRYCVPAAYGGALPALDSRALCLVRETLAWHDGLADFAFAMQGLGSGAITLAGTEAQRARWLPAVARGEAIAAFALSEPDAGSDVAAMTTRARPRRRRIGCSTAARRGSPTAASPISIACSPAPASASGTSGISAFVVPADTPGLVDRRADRDDRAAPAGPSRVRRLPAARRRAAGRGRARASSSRCARSTSFARRSRRRRWVSPAARWTKRRRARARGRCSAACWPTCS